MGLDNPLGPDTWYMPSGGLVSGLTVPQFIVPVFNGTGGAPTRAIHVSVLTTNTVAIMEMRRIGNEWVNDGALARDAEVTLSQTMVSVNNLTAFAIENPVAETANVLFLVYNNASATPDALVIDSIDMAGGATLAAVAVTIAGANAIPAADLVAAVGCATTTSKAKFMSQDDWYSADITGTVAGFTFTFTDAVVTAVDTSINVNTTLAVSFSMYLIGTTIVLMKHGGATGGASLTPLSMWSITTAGVKIAEYLNVAVGGEISTASTAQNNRLFAVDGSFAIAAIIGVTNAWLIRKFALANLTAN